MVKVGTYHVGADQENVRLLTAIRAVKWSRACALLSEFERIAFLLSLRGLAGQQAFSDNGTCSKGKEISAVHAFPTFGVCDENTV
jgi:hypothetical protein